MIENREAIQSEINALNQLLSGTDYKAIKRSEGEISDEDYQKSREQRRGWRVRIRELSAQLEEMEAAGDSAAE